MLAQNVNFSTGPGLTPEFKLSADSLRAFAEALIYINYDYDL
jgi:hypothetical protein